MIVGKRGWLYDDFFARLEGSPAKQAVIFPGFVPDADLPAVYAGSAGAGVSQRVRGVWLAGAGGDGVRDAGGLLEYIELAGNNLSPRPPPLQRRGGGIPLPSQGRGMRTGGEYPPRSVDPLDVDALADALRRVLAMPAGGRSACRGRAGGPVLLERAAAETLAVYRQVAAKEAIIGEVRGEKAFPRDEDISTEALTPEHCRVAEGLKTRPVVGRSQSAAWPLMAHPPALRQHDPDGHAEPPDRPKMTYEEFLAWADEDTLAEWVNGEVVMTSPASNRHQDLIGFLESVLRPFVETHQLGIVRSAPFQMKLEHGREPDLLFVAQAHMDRLKRNYLDGPADLVIEIISPESAGRDRGEKFYEYAAGWRAEYWLIDPDTHWAEIYRLSENRYRLAFEGGEGEYHAVDGARLLAAGGMAMAGAAAGHC